MTFLLASMKYWNSRDLAVSRQSLAGSHVAQGKRSGGSSGSCARWYWSRDLTHHRLGRPLRRGTMAIMTPVTIPHCGVDTMSMIAGQLELEGWCGGLPGNGSVSPEARAPLGFAVQASQARVGLRGHDRPEPRGLQGQVGAREFLFGPIGQRLSGVDGTLMALGRGTRAANVI